MKVKRTVDVATKNGTYWLLGLACGHNASRRVKRRTHKRRAGTTLDPVAMGSVPEPAPLWIYCALCARLAPSDNRALLVPEVFQGPPH